MNTSASCNGTREVAMEERGPPKEACAATLLMFVSFNASDRPGKLPTQEKLVFLYFFFFFISI